MTIWRPYHSSVPQVVRFDPACSALEADHSLGLALASPDSGDEPPRHTTPLSRLAQRDFWTWTIVTLYGGEDRVDLVVFQDFNQGVRVIIVYREDLGSEFLLLARIRLREQQTGPGE